MGLGAAFRLPLCSLSHERILGRTPQPPDSRDSYGGFDGRRVPEGILDGPRTQDTTFRPFAHAICLDRKAGIWRRVRQLRATCTGHTFTFPKRKRSPPRVRRGEPRCSDWRLADAVVPVDLLTAIGPERAPSDAPLKH
jgi:hypothetical protein